MVTEVIWTVFIALRFRHGHIYEHLVWIGVAKLAMTRRVSDLAMKVMNDCNVDDEVMHPCNIQTLELQIATLLAAASWNALATVGLVTCRVCNVCNC